MLWVIESDPSFSACQGLICGHMVLDQNLCVLTLAATFSMSASLQKRRSGVCHEDVLLDSSLGVFPEVAVSAAWVAVSAAKMQPFQLLTVNEWMSPSLYATRTMLQSNEL